MVNVKVPYLIGKSQGDGDGTVNLRSLEVTQVDKSFWKIILYHYHQPHLS